MQVECAICGKKCRGQIPGVHLKSHGINTRQYEELYGSAFHPEFKLGIVERARKGGGNASAKEAKAREKAANITSYQASPKQCQRCSTVLTYKQRHNRFCSQSCAATAINTERATIYSCRSCGTRVAKGRNYCSSQCQANETREKVIADWLSGGQGGNVNVHRSVRRYLIEQANHQCSRCGWGEINPVTGHRPLHIDHIDGDATNHRVGNLRVLCPNCHSLTPNYGALNKGRGKRGRLNKAQPSPSTS